MNAIHALNYTKIANQKIRIINQDVTVTLPQKIIRQFADF